MEYLKEGCSEVMGDQQEDAGDDTIESEEEEQASQDESGPDGPFLLGSFPCQYKRESAHGFLNKGTATPSCATRRKG